MKELPSEEEEIPFRIKTYKKKELACMYNPNITPRCAIRIFTKWIKINKELLRLLTATGYHPRTRTFTLSTIRVTRILRLYDCPGIRQQIPRTIRSICTPCSEAS